MSKNRIRVRIEFVCNSDVDISHLSRIDLNSVCEKVIRSTFPKEWWADENNYVNVEPGAKFSFLDMSPKPKSTKRKRK